MEKLQKGQMMTQSYVKINSGDLILEGVWHLPDGKSPFPAVIVCHPHTMYGGEMSNNVVMAVCQGLCQQGIAALRFNFRGAGGSQGDFDDGAGEQDDIKSVLRFVIQDTKIDSSRIGLAGYSFGAGVALTVAPTEEQIKAIALISPPLEMAQGANFYPYKAPKLIIGGSEDAFFSPIQLEAQVRKLSKPKEYEIIRGADHFWFGYEPQLAAKIIPFFKRHLNLD